MIRDLRLRWLPGLAAATMAATPVTPISVRNAVANEGAPVAAVAGRLPRTASDSPRPITVIDRRDIELSGMTNVEDLLARTVCNTFGSHRPFVLGNSRTAVLVDGRRISDSSFDLGTLPISAVERIEILGDSASAPHGEHAIGGAINIVLRRGHEGMEFRAGGARPARAGGDSEHASALWGGALGGGRLMVGIDGFRREEVRDAARDYSRAAGTPGRTFASTRGISIGGNTIFVPGGDGGTLARSLGTCDENIYAGIFRDPAGISGEGRGFAYADTARHR